MHSDFDVLAVERAASRAWPPQRVVDVAGWQVRLSGGGSRRANSVLPLQHDGSSLDDAIAAAERLYRAQQTRSYFQVTSISQPTELDAVLAARGYAEEERCCLMAKHLGETSMPADIEVRTTPSDAWLEVYGSTLDLGRRAAVPAVLAAVPPSRGFLLLRRNGSPVATALAVVSPDGIVLVECVATLAQARRSGAAQRVMDALEAWSFAQGATVAALQVVAANTAACTLYEGRGYREIGRYHYRWKDV